MADPGKISMEGDICAYGGRIAREGERFDLLIVSDIIVGKRPTNAMREAIKCQCPMVSEEVWREMMTEITGGHPFRVPEYKDQLVVGSDGWVKRAVTTNGDLAEEAAKPAMRSEVDQMWERIVAKNTGLGF